MIEKITILSLMLFCSGCVWQIERKDGPIYKKYEISNFSKADAEIKANEMYAKDVATYETEQKAKEDAKNAQEVEWQRQDAERLAKLKKYFDKEMATYKCSKEKWSRYEFSEYFQRLSKEYGISSYDVAWGDQYTKRKISKFLQIEIMNNALKYTYHWSEAEVAIYNQNKKAVFNQLVKRDYGCYLELK